MTVKPIQAISKLKGLRTHIANAFGIMLTEWIIGRLAAFD